MPYYVITDRFHGDDEATAMAFDTPMSSDAAVRNFKEEMCALRNLEPEDAQAVLSDNTPVSVKE